MCGASQLPVRRRLYQRRPAVTSPGRLVQHRVGKTALCHIRASSTGAGRPAGLWSKAVACRPDACEESEELRREDILRVAKGSTML